jgi:hypothetical protein
LCVFRYCLSGRGRTPATGRRSAPVGRSTHRAIVGAEPILDRLAPQFAGIGLDVRRAGANVPINEPDSFARLDGVADAFFRQPEFGMIGERSDRSGKRRRSGQTSTRTVQGTARRLRRYPDCGTPPERPPGAPARRVATCRVLLQLVGTAGERFALVAGTACQKACVLVRQAYFPFGLGPSGRRTHQASRFYYEKYPFRLTSAVLLGES